MSKVEEITEPSELTADTEVRFLAKQERATVFYFHVDRPLKVTIDSWELDGETATNTDIFVTVNDENVSKDNYHWKSEYGVDKIDIYPDRNNFKQGKYRVAV